MPDFDQQHPADDEKASQQVHPAKPERDDDTSPHNPSEAPPGRPQHDANDPDEQEW